MVQHGQITYMAEPAKADAVAMAQQQNAWIDNDNQPSINNDNRPLVPQALGYVGADPLQAVSHNPFHQDSLFRHSSEVHAGVDLDFIVHLLLSA